MYEFINTYYFKNKIFYENLFMCRVITANMKEKTFIITKNQLNIQNNSMVFYIKLIELSLFLPLYNFKMH